MSARSSEHPARLAASLTRRWVNFYTRRLPDVERALRREELASDLWEHQSADHIAGRPAWVTALTIVLRLLLGVPADLAWRREVLAEQRAASERITSVSRATPLQTALFWLTVVCFIVIPIAFGIANISGWDMYSDDAGWRSFVGACAIGFAALVAAGLALGQRLAWLGAVLIILGTLPLTFLFFTLLPVIYALFAAGAIYYAVQRARIASGPAAA